jgi:hypothetical protein
MRLNRQTVRLIKELNISTRGGVDGRIGNVGIVRQVWEMRDRS